MHALGRRLARVAPPGTVVGLDGALGTGKTVLVQGLAAGLGLDQRRVTSPSFALCHLHPGGRLLLVHIDLYRLADEAEAQDAGLLEYIDDPGQALVAVEWYERLGRATAPVHVRIAFAGGSRRTVTLRAPLTLLRDIRPALARRSAR